MNMVRAAIERLYKGLCSVKVKVSSVNEETGETVFTEKAVFNRTALPTFISKPKFGGKGRRIQHRIAIGCAFYCA